MKTHPDAILFQGDSITDCARVRERAEIPNDLKALGQGYAMMAASRVLSAQSAVGFQFFNRGMSGNRVVDLYARIKSDLINLAPGLVSILVGVNDTWHEQGNRNGVHPSAAGHMLMAETWLRHVDAGQLRGASDS